METTAIQKVNENVSFLERIKIFIWKIKSSFIIFYGIIFYIFAKRTPYRVILNFVRLFCLTRGKSNDFLTKIVPLFCRNKLIIKEQEECICPEILGSNKESIISDFKTKGYCVFNKKLSDSLLNELVNFAHTKPFKLRQIYGQTQDRASEAIYSPEKPNSIVYDAKLEELINCKAVQKLLCDPSLLRLAELYLGAPPIIDYPAMWWLTSYSKIPDEEAAQMFHFDLERIRWIKIFIYLTDVNEENGPHVFIEGTHKSGVIPWSLLKKGYVRLSDDLVKAEMPHFKWKEFIADKGTIFAEDTIGLHKGGSVKSGSRLLLQFQFCNSLFANNLPRIPMPKDPIPEFAECMKLNPKVFSGFMNRP
jgi:hypothetical protein